MILMCALIKLRARFQEIRQVLKITDNLKRHSYCRGQAETIKLTANLKRSGYYRGQAKTLKITSVENNGQLEEIRFLQCNLLTLSLAAMRNNRAIKGIKN